MSIVRVKAPHKWEPPEPEVKEEEVYLCIKCGCKWLELMELQQFPKDDEYVLGQKPTPKMSFTIWMYRCPKCNEMYELQTHNTGTDATRKAYDEFLDHMIKLPTAKGENI